MQNVALFFFVALHFLLLSLSSDRCRRAAGDVLVIAAVKVDSKLVLQSRA